MEPVQCSWCDHPFQIAPASSPRAFDCPNCGEPNTLGALRSRLRIPNPGEVVRTRGQAVTDNISRCSLAYGFLNARGEEELASGTLVQIRDRQFMATVAHARPAHVEQVTFARNGKFLAPGEWNGAIRRIANTGSDADVAAIELAPETGVRLGIEAIGLDRICDLGPGTSETPARVIGYPSAWILSKKQARGFFALSYGCEPVEAYRWHGITKKANDFDAGVDVFVFYCDDVVDIGRTQAPGGLPDPRGMSGGGFWQRPAPTPTDRIWNPEDVRLFAIQSRWLVDAEFLRGVQIAHWLKLVADHYPDLADELTDRFPRLKTM
jgi:predicted RNA-binding Zn-ribbon protein involved in translation (DUF1610 family)